MKPNVPTLLSFNAGYVDTAGFLALQGLFTAHVTGNFVTLGASYVLGTTGAAAKLLALPVFCAVVLCSRLASYGLQAKGFSVLKSLLVAKLVLLVLGAALAVYFGPFASASSPIAVVTGLVLVSAMAIQNAASRIQLGSAPPTTLMTGTTTQVMIDLADLIRGVTPDATSAARQRLGKMVTSVGAFAIGCGLAALCFAAFGSWSFALPPLLAIAALLGVEEPAAAA